MTAMSFTEISRIAADAFNRLILWVERASQRRVLSELDDNMLKDIGLTRHDAFAESVRPFWSGGVRSGASNPSPIGRRWLRSSRMRGWSMNRLTAHAAAPHPPARAEAMLANSRHVYASAGEGPSPAATPSPSGRGVERDTA